MTGRSTSTTTTITPTTAGRAASHDRAARAAGPARGRVRLRAQGRHARRPRATGALVAAALLRPGSSDPAGHRRATARRTGRGADRRPHGPAPIDRRPRRAPDRDRPDRAAPAAAAPAAWARLAAPSRQPPDRAAPLDRQPLPLARRSALPGRARQLGASLRPALRLPQ